VSVSEVRLTINSFLLRAEVLANRARDAYLATPVDNAGGQSRLRELSAMFEREMPVIYGQVFTRPGGAMAKEYEYTPTGLAPFSSLVEALDGGRTDVRVLGSSSAADSFTRPIELVAEHLRIWRVRFAESPESAEAVMLAVRALGLMGHRLRGMSRRGG